MLNELDKAIIRELQNGLPLVSRPFLQMAGKLGLTENELIDRIKRMIEDGLIRRFGAAVRHQDLGFVANAMVVWDVPDERVMEVGKIMAGFEEVSHCYRRPRRPGWPYNLFTVIHGQTRQECERIAVSIAGAAGVEEYRLLFSTAELKKSTMRYFE
ncbi:MAG: AsnC family transcriptional regulator [Firmicutes bacterium]|nr:AsnC family transcriptional regulator [Bacillota bacterium]